jgi:hypothetical protein
MNFLTILVEFGLKVRKIAVSYRIMYEMYVSFILRCGL